MSSNSGGDHRLAADLYKLVCHIVKQPAESVKLQYRWALQNLKCNSANCDTDEFGVSEKIKKKLANEKRAEDALAFAELHRKLQTSAFLNKRVRVLHFLYFLQGSDADGVFSEKLSLGSQELMLNSRDIVNGAQTNRAYQPAFELGDILLKSQKSDFSSNLYAPSSGLSNKDAESVQNRVARVAALFSNGTDKRFPTQPRKASHGSERALSARSDDSNLGSVCLTVPNLKVLIRDILFAVQGLKGDVIVWDPDRSNFNAVFKEEFPNPLKKITLRFLELGWMFCRINSYCKIQSSEKSLGLVAQSFIAALKEKLATYYKLIAELEALLNQENSLNNLYCSSNSLTLHKLSVWFFEPHTQLKILASVVDACKGKKGGALASVLYSHLQHGDQYVQALVQSLLKVVTRPLFKFLSNWIYCGELDDPFGEFFVATNVAVPDCSLWQERYSLNKAMIPSFITMEQARKILSSGKAINFLRQVCQDSAFTCDEDRRVRALELMSTESLFQERDGNFESILEKNYVKTSKTVLQVLHDKYNLMDHLLAMRNYFLLGQGDFIRHLMDLLDTDLAKPANSLYIHNLTGILESAIRATNAQFHNPEVLQRLDVRHLEVSVGDCGWDVFSLDYHVDGPIGTVFTPHCMNSYLRLFTTLWRAKRMEYILSKISQSRTTYLKLQEKVPEVTPVLYQCHVILAQMVHFVQQMQYYMAFEVMECCWADLLLKIQSAHDLDEVIAAHENFLDTLITRTLLDEESKGLRSHLKAIYDCIITFDKIQADFWSEVRGVVEKLDALSKQIEANTYKGEWGTDKEQKREYEIYLEKLKTKTIPKTKASLRTDSKLYEDMVQKFLLMLNNQDDANLRFLSFRLDFNEYFKSKNSCLQTSLTYQHRRKSIK